MKNFEIFTDSCSDLGQDVRKKYDIQYVNMHITYDDKDLLASLDWDLYSPKELYDLMRNGTLMKTTQVPVEEFMRKFEESLSKGLDILYIACSSALSGSVNTSYVVRDELLEKYPDRKIVCIDSLNSCLGEGSMTVDAAKMREEGKSLEEIASYIESEKLKYNQFATVEDLKYLKNAGRIKASKAFFGNIFGVKPIIISDVIGQNYALKKVKGRRASLIELVNMAKEAILDAENQTVSVIHADCIEDAEFVKDLIVKEINPKEVYVNYMGPIIGISTGPGTIGLYCKGQKVETLGE